ncbi:S-methyl-5-thioribose-1-phosphate isomerase, partial [bacterium]
MSFRTIEWRDNKVVMLDQTRLPGEEIYNEYRDFKSVAEAIRGMVIRGAPAIGVAAAMGVALG